MFDEKEEKHESFAMLGFTRVQSNHGNTLYGSDLKHNTFIRMDLHHSRRRRGLNRSWYHADKLIASVEMSQNQFAELITSMNMGDGIPVTLKRTERDGEMEDPEFIEITELHENEFKNAVREVSKEGEELITKMKDILSGSGTVKKADREELIKDMESVIRNIGSNMPYMEDCFRENMDKVVTDAKGTIESFYQKRVIDAGIESLSDCTMTKPPRLTED